MDERQRCAVSGQPTCPTPGTGPEQCSIRCVGSNQFQHRFSRRQICCRPACKQLGRRGHIGGIGGQPPGSWPTEHCSICSCARFPFCCRSSCRDRQVTVVQDPEYAELACFWPPSKPLLIVGAQPLLGRLPASGQTSRVPAPCCRSPERLTWMSLHLPSQGCR